MNPLVLIILDGWGCRPDKKDNGIAQAHKPNFDSFWKNYPHTLIEGSGPSVGLPKGIMGNSEVGHMNLGAGRIVYTGLSQIYQAIEDKSFFKNKALLSAGDAAKKNQSVLHLMGLLSEGAVHSHQDHLYALLKLAKKEGIQKVFIHCFMDGRDTSPNDGIKYIQQLESKIREIGIGQIASISGRYYAMDRDKRWERVQKAYDVLVGVNPQENRSPQRIIEDSYKKNIGDEFIIPQAVLDEKGNPVGPMQDGDAVIFFNFRADRAREITRALTDPHFKEFERRSAPRLACFVCMAPYDETFNLPVAFVPHYPIRIFAEVISEKGLKQLRVAETEKYAHVTFFFNGGRERVFPGEDRVLIPSPREVATYDQKPEMSAPQITEEVCQKLKTSQYDIVILNFANADMVGHTAHLTPIVHAIESVDQELGKIVSLVLQMKGHVVITADHGNAEQVVDANGEPMTSHTTNPVPFILISDSFKNVKLKSQGGRLCDVAPTLLQILDMDQPPEMTGESLIL